MKLRNSYFQRFPGKGSIELDLCFGSDLVDVWDVETVGLGARVTETFREYYIEGSLLFWAFRVSFSL